LVDVGVVAVEVGGGGGEGLAVALGGEVHGHGGGEVAVVSDVGGGDVEFDFGGCEFDAHGVGVELEVEV
jgi:hypothetical protein